MPHHFNKATVEASCWCNKCGKETPWRIADGRRQYCITCYERPKEAKVAEPAKTGDLFGESPKGIGKREGK